jgi:general secretion pathway protein L
MMTLLKHLQSQPWRRLAGEALAWWLAELSCMVPGKVRSWWTTEAARPLHLELAPDGEQLLIRSDTKREPLGVPSAATNMELTGLKSQDVGGMPVEVSLGNAWLFRPVIELPLAAERSVGPIVHHQLERLVPLDPSTLRYVWHIVERVPAANRLMIEVVIVKQATIDRVMALAHTLGLVIDSVTVSGVAARYCAIWRRPLVPKGTPRQLWIRRGLEVVAVACLAAAYGLRIWHLDAESESLRDSILHLQAQNRAVQALQVRVLKVESILADAGRQYSAPTALKVLDVLTRAIPLDSSVSEFHLQATEADISGIAPHATRLLTAIERESLFRNPSFLGPIVSAGDGERYQIGFQIRPGTTP